MVETASWPNEEPPRTYYDWNDACELARYIAAIPLPYATPSNCQMKTEAMLRSSLAAGFEPSGLGVGELYIPDLSVRGIHDAYMSEECMSYPYLAPWSFEEYMAAAHRRGITANIVQLTGVCLGSVIVDGHQKILVERASETEKPLDRKGLFVERQRWQLWLPNQKTLFCNHTSMAIYVRPPGANQSQLMVIDPAHSREVPLSLSDWHRKHGYQDAILMTTMLSDPSPNMRIRTEFMGGSRHIERLARAIGRAGLSVPTTLDGISDLIKRASPEDYRTIVKDFFNLYPAEKEDNRQNSYYDATTYALHLAERVCAGAAYLPPVSELRRAGGVERIIEALWPLKIYEIWRFASIDGISPYPQSYGWENDAI